MISQTERVVELLRERGEEGLTPLEAMRLVGTMRLAARIADAKDPMRRLLKDDEVIITEHYRVDEATTVAKYVLRKRTLPIGVIQDSLGW